MCIICTYFVCILRVVGGGVDLCALVVHISSVFLRVVGREGELGALFIYF